ncbi:MAG: hypothetical protein OES24_07365 [Acidimicrobiia bacterium]|nr:hypothetical protein [Acidimicrobiia bacterium]
MMRRRAVLNGLATVILLGLTAACGIGADTPPVDGYDIAGAPQYPLFDHTLTWTGTDVIVVGGAGGDPTDGELVDEPLIWNPNEGVRPITSPPGPPLNRHTAVWTGEELIVWSGTTVPFGVGDGLVASTAAYDPDSDTWRELAGSPMEVARVRGRGAAFADHIIVTGGSTPQSDNEGTIGVYDLESDSWATTAVDGDALTTVATGNATYVLWADRQSTVRLSQLDVESATLTEIPLPDLPEGADRSNAVVADGRLIVWAEASPPETGVRSDELVTVLVLDDDRALAADPTRPAAWRELVVQVDFPGSATGFSEVRPLVHTDDWLAFMEGAELKWIRIADGLEIRRTLTTPQSCAFNTEAVGTPSVIVAWGGNCSRFDDDGNEQQIVEHFVFEPPAVDE